MHKSEWSVQRFEALVKEYYRKFDLRLPLDQFESDFDWDDFIIRSPDSKVTTKQEYADFYQHISDAFVDSNHKVSNFIVTEQDDRCANAECEVVFTAKQQPSLTSVIVRGYIQFSFRAYNTPDEWRISRYIIEGVS